jgi:hypothetical protein
LSALIRFYALKRRLGALMRLLGAGDCCDGPAVEGSVTFLLSWERFGDDRIRVGRMVEWCLLLVEDVPAPVLGSLVVVELYLVCVAAVLGETQFGLAPVDRGDSGTVIVIGAGTVGVERCLCFVEMLLVLVSADLFAFGDALV